MRFLEWGHSIESVIHSISGLGRKIASVLLFLMILLMAADVVGRYIFSRPIKGTVDLIEETILFMVRALNIMYPIVKTGDS